MAISKKLVLKVREGTRSDGKRLCDSCSASTIVKGAAESQEFVYCRQLPDDGLVPVRVVECSKYEDKAAPSLYNMEQIAWVLVTNKSGMSIGFVSPDKWSKEKRGEKLPDFD